MVYEICEPLFRANSKISGCCDARRPTIGTTTASIRGWLGLGENYADVREECLALLGIKDQLTDMAALGAGYTNGGIHTAQWKAFMFKSGNRFIEEKLCAGAENYGPAPGGFQAWRRPFLHLRSTAIHHAPLGLLQGLHALSPWGDHPYNNAEQKCWLRVNDNLAQNALKDKDQIALGEKYHWHDGEGSLRRYLHDASNESDQVRVVLWLDLQRKMPFYASLFNRFVLWLAGRDKSVEKIRKKRPLMPRGPRGHRR